VKKIHFISLEKCYSFITLNARPSYEIFTRLTVLIPNVNRYFIGPFFTSTDEATSIAYQGFQLVSDKNLLGVDLASGPFDSRLGTENILKKIVPRELLQTLDMYYLWGQVSSLIKDNGEYLTAAKKAIDSVFDKIDLGDECLIFTVFPFGEMLCQEFSKKTDDVPIFSFLQGFSLINDGSVFKTVLLQ
jgi:hypothetical protein